MKALIVSLNPNVAHVSHLIAHYLQFKELGHFPILYIHKNLIQYIPEDFNYLEYNKFKTCKTKADIAFFYSPAFGNLLEMIKLKLRYKTKIMLVKHEPFDRMVLIDNTSSYWKRLWYMLANLYGCIPIYLSNIIILPSGRAIDLYEKGWLYFNKHYFYLPLQFDDESSYDNSTVKRKYFSYIGSIGYVTNNHSFDSFLNFIETAIQQEFLKELNFLIVTKNTVIIDERLQEMINTGRLSVIEGKPLSNESINFYYKSSFVVWNAYARNTQSGVLAKSFMFGTPAIVLRRNISEFVKDGDEVAAIDDNNSYDEISDALYEIINNYEHYSNAARKCFLENFYYRKNNAAMKSIMEKLFKYNLIKK
jgi:glycosyltransferase involved in cell wall biosynthesis